MHAISELKKMTVLDLREISKELNIVGRHKMKKAELIDAIAKVQYLDVEPVVEDEKPEGQKERYIKNAAIGLLVAFKASKTRALSGKIEEIHDSSFLVKTKNGICFTVKKEDVLWFKTGERWPKWVYLALKGESLVESEATYKGYKAR